MFSLVPYAFSWTGVFNQDYIQEAVQAFLDVESGSRRAVATGLQVSAGSLRRGTRRNFRGIAPDGVQ